MEDITPCYTHKATAHQQINLQSTLGKLEAKLNYMLTGT